MSTEPEFPPFSGPDPEAERPSPLPVESTPLPQLHAPRTIPNLGHAVLFIVVAGGTLFLTEIAAFASVMGLHIFSNEPAERLLRDPRLLIPAMAVSYLIAGLLAWAIFSNLWRRPFAQGIRWNAAIVRRRFYLFLAIGMLLSLALQFLSSYLPIPKTLPINDFFRTRRDVWLIVIFGTLMAPAFEELAFRGFLFPSLASAWDWMARGVAPAPAAEDNSADLSPGTGSVLKEPEQIEQPRDPHWSKAALVFSSTITSIGFTLLHADQLAHSWAPLSVLFAVSIVLCVVRLRFHSLAASTLVHATYNGTIFALLFFATDGFRHLDKAN